MTDRRRVAAFDFDGTITQRDTLAGFLAFVGGRSAVARASARRSLAMVAGLRDDGARDRAKEAVLGDVLAGRSHDELQAAGERYAARLPARYRPDIVERMGWHRGEGHELVIVSASLAYYLDPVARALDVDHVIGVEMAVGGDGRLTGALAFPNVRGDQKAVRLRAWLTGEADQSSPVPDGPGLAPGRAESEPNGPERTFELWAYGNSSGDEALLALADHPTWVGRRATR